MKNVTQILPLEETTVNNPSNSSGVTAGAIAGATEVVTVAAVEQQRSDGGLITKREGSDTRATPKHQRE